MDINFDEVGIYLDEEEQNLYDEREANETQLDDICQECWDPDCEGCN